jgi:Cys-tRNA(Pro) deacylase
MEDRLFDDPRTKRVVDAGAEIGIQVAAVRFPGGTRTAVEAARAVGCELAQIVKTLVFLDESGKPIIFFVSGVDRLDLYKGAAAAGVEILRKADADAIEQATGYPIGGVPPFGHATAIPAVMDERLLAFGEVWAGAGLPDAVFPIDPRDLRRSTDATIDDVRE